MLEENQIQELKALVDSLTAQGIPNADIQLQIDNKKAEFLKLNEAGKQLSQGQGAPVAETAAPESMALQPEVGSLESQEEELSWGEIFVGAAKNIKPAVLASWESTKGASLDWLKKVAGEDATDFLVGKTNNQAVAFIDPENNKKITFKENKEKWLDLAKKNRSVDTEIKKVYVDSGKDVGEETEKEMLNMFNKASSYKLQQKNLGGFISGVKEGDAKQFVGGALTGITSLVTTMVPAIATRGASLMPQMYGDMYVSYNEAKAKEKYGDDPDAFKKLVENDETEVSTPLALAGIAAALEKVGLKGVTKAIAGSTIKGKGAVLKMWSMLGEGSTEYAQTLVESYNESLGAGESQSEALNKVVNAMGSEEAWEAAIQGAFGAGVISSVGSGVRKINAKIRKNTGNAVGADLDILGILRQKEAIAKDPDVKEGIKKQITDIENSIKEKVKKGNEIVESLSENETKEIISSDEALEDFKQKIFNLNEKAKNGEITQDEQAIAREGFIAEYKKLKEKIDSSIQSAKNRGNQAAEKQKEASKKAQELYEKVIVNEEVSQAKKDQAKADIVSLFEPSVNRIVNKYRDRPGFNQMKEDLTSELLYSKSGVLGLVDTYNKSKSDSIGAYVNSYLERRGIAIADKLLGKDEGSQFMTDVTESKTVMSEEAADATIDTREQLEAAPKQKKIAEKINIGTANQSVFKEAAKKALGSRLPSVENEKEFKKALDDSFRTQLTTAVKNISGTRKAYERFLKENWKSLYDAIPQDVVNKRFEQFNEKVIDPKTGKQKRETMAEGTAAGKGVFKKRTDVTQQEFMDYMLAKGSTKGARKNALSEMLATQMGFDEVLDAIKDPEIDKKFKEIQEMQGNVVPENYVERIAKSIDRAIDYLDNLQKNDGTLYSSFAIPELTIAVAKAFLVTVKNSIKAGQSFKQALEAGIKKAQELFVSKEDKQKVSDIAKEIYPDIDSLNNQKNAVAFTKKVDSLIKENLKTLTEETLFSDLQSSLNAIENTEGKIQATKNFIRLYSRSIRTANKNLSKNSDIFAKLKEVLPKDLIGKNGFNLKKVATGQSIFFKDKKIDNVIDTTNSSIRKKIVENTDSVINEINDQSLNNNKIVIETIKSLKEDGDLNKAFYILKLWQTDQRSPLRLAGKIGIVFDKFKGYDKRGELKNEHNPPIQSIVEKIEKYLKGDLSLDAIQKEIDNSRQNFVSKEFESLIPKKYKSKAAADRLSIPLSKDFKYKEYNTSEIVENNKIKTAENALLENAPVEPNADEINSMSTTINQMIERKKGVPSGQIISKATAKLAGAKKGKFKVFVPPSAEDLQGLLYAFYGTGKQGDADMEFMDKKLLKPIAKANYQLNAERQLVKQKFHNLVKNNKGIMKKLRAESAYKFYNNDSAVRVWVWDKLGYEIPGLNASDKKELLKGVETDPKLLKFAEELINVPNSKESWLTPEKDWTASSIEMDLQEILSKIGRARIFKEFIENKNIIFSEDNLNKIEAAYGPDYKSALEDMLYRVEKGKARELGGNKLANAYLNWVRGSVATTMFFNMRSALLQQLSVVNFTNWSDNNPIAQAKLLANPKKYAQYWSEIFNSDWMKERRQGLKTDINEAELAARMQGSKDKKKALLSYILEKGFSLTKYGDNIAIANGGAAFLYNREKTYLKQGLSAEQAKKDAFLDFQELAEQTQQSSRQDLLSNQQVSIIGRLFLAFQNTPMQMTRLTKKATLDLINRRGNVKENISRIVYYSAIQNITFAALQSALFAAIGLDDEEEDEKFIDKKTERVVNTVLDGVLRGSGIAGATIATVKNALIRWKKESEKGWKGDDAYVLLELLNVSPAVGIKARKAYGAMKSYKVNRKILDKVGYDNPNHPMYGIAGSVASGAFNIPLDRVITKASNLKAMTQKDAETWQRTALFLGYNSWDLGLEDPEITQARKDARKKKKPKSTGIKGLKMNKIKGLKIKK